MLFTFSCIKLYSSLLLCICFLSDCSLPCVLKRPVTHKPYSITLTSLLNELTCTLQQLFVVYKERIMHGFTSMAARGFLASYTSYMYFCMTMVQFNLTLPSLQLSLANHHGTLHMILKQNQARRQGGAGGCTCSPFQTDIYKQQHVKWCFSLRLMAI